MVEGLQKNSLYDAQAAVFSSDGSVLYITTETGNSGRIFSIKSDGILTWISLLGGITPCDIAVSPDGVSVRLLEPPPQTMNDRHASGRHQFFRTTTQVHTEAKPFSKLRQALS